MHQQRRHTHAIRTRPGDSRERTCRGRDTASQRDTDTKRVVCTDTRCDTLLTDKDTCTGETDMKQRFVLQPLDTFECESFMGWTVLEKLYYMT